MNKFYQNSDNINNKDKILFDYIILIYKLSNLSNKKKKIKFNIKSLKEKISEFKTNNLEHISEFEKIDEINKNIDHLSFSNKSIVIEAIEKDDYLYKT